MRRIFLAALFALPVVLIEAAPAQAQMYGGSSQGGYYRQSLYGGSPAPYFGAWGGLMRMYPLIHFHGPLVNYGPYEGYYPFQPYGPWTSDLKYNGPPIPKHGHLNNQTPGTGWIWGEHSHGWSHYALATFHNVGLRTHPFKHGCKNCGASADISSGIVAVENVAVAPVVRER
jgi:hypothetical protein